MPNYEQLLFEISAGYTNVFLSGFCNVSFDINKP